MSASGDGSYGNHHSAFDLGLRAVREAIARCYPAESGEITGKTRRSRW